MADAQKGASFLDSKIEKKPRLTSPRHHSASVQDLWQRGLPSGDKVGWPTMDKHYTVVPGQLTILTGWPGSGKSEFLDAMLINLSRQGWKFAMFSFENQPVSYHITKLLEKMACKPFGKGPNERMTIDEVAEFTDELAQSFAFTETTAGGFSLTDVLEAAAPFLAQFDDTKRGLVIDPWNELEHWRPQGLSETEYVSQALSQVRNWARTNKVHVWIVAHPAKMKREDGKLPIPKPDMIAGSQHWWNKADCALTVYRNFDDINSQRVEIHVQKIRFKHVGQIGVVELMYDKVTGRYHEPSPGQLYAVPSQKHVVGIDI
jgi:twinkle protein